MVTFNNKFKPKAKEVKAKKQNTFCSVNALCEGLELTLNALRSGIFLIRATKGKEHLRLLALRHSDCAQRRKILTPKQMLQRLPIALAQVKAGETSKNLLNEIKKIIYSSNRIKVITKKVYNNIMNSIKL